jgi:hypothetical protein
LACVVASLGCAAPEALDVPDAAPGADAGSSSPVASPDAASAPPAADADAAPPEVTDAGSAPAGRVPYRATAIALGDLHACALLDDGHVKCWGSNDYGQLGLGDTVRRNGPVLGDALPTVDLGNGRRATAIAAGRYTSCASLDDGSFKCWGWPALTGGTATHGGTPGTMGDALPRLDLGPGRTMRQAAVGYARAFGLLDDGSVKAWSIGAPVEVRSASAAPAVVALTPAFTGYAAALFADGSLALLDASSQPVDTRQIADLPMGEPIRTIGGSEEMVCITLVAGGVRCADARMTTQGAPSSYAAVAGDYPCALRDDGSVICFGGSVGWWLDSNPPASEPGRLVALGQPAKAIAGGSQGGATPNMCAVLADGTVKCWSESPSPGYGLSGIAAAYPAEQRSGPWLPVDLGTRPGS